MSINWSDNSQNGYLDMLFGSDNSLYLLLQPFVLMKFNSQMRLDWVMKLKSTTNTFNTKRLLLMPSKKMIVSHSSNIYVLNSTNGQLISLLTIPNAIGVDGLAKQPDIQDEVAYFICHNSTNSNLYKYDLSKSANSMISYAFGGIYSTFELDIQKFFTNNVFNGLFIGGNLIYYFDLSTSINVLNSYSYGTSVKFSFPKVIATSSATYAVMIDTLDANSFCRFMKIGSDGSILKFMKIGVSLTMIYDAVINPLNSLIEVSGEYSSSSITYVIRYDPMYYGTKYHIEFYNEYSSTPGVGYLHFRDSQINISESECVLYSFIMYTSSANASSLSVPTAKTSVLTGTTLSYFGVIGTILSFSSYSALYLTSCFSYGITPYYRVSTIPVKFSYTGYASVNIGALFCSITDSSSLEVEVNPDASETKDVSWLSFNSPSYTLIGTALEQNSNYSISILVRENEVSIQYPLSLILSYCISTSCEICSSGSVCQKCQSQYTLEDNETKCVSKIGITSAKTAGIITSIMTLLVAIGAVSTIYFCGHKGTFQNIFSVLEYFQMCVAIVLLKTDFSDLVFDFLESFKIYKFDFIEVGSWIGLSSYLLYKPVGCKQENSKLEKLGYIYSSSVINFVNLGIILLVIVLIHLLIFIIFCTYRIHDDISEHLSKLKADKSYRPKLKIVFLSKLCRIFNRSIYITLFFCNITVPVIELIFCIYKLQN